MAFITLEDLLGTIEVIIFPNSYEKYHHLLKEDEKIFTNVISNETALIYWLLQYGEHVKVVSPLSLKEKVKEKILKILED